MRKKICTMLLLVTANIAQADQVGDMNGDGKVGIQDAIIALQISTDIPPQIELGECTKVECLGSLSPLGRWCDNGDGTIKDMTSGLVWFADGDALVGAHKYCEGEASGLNAVYNRSAMISHLQDGMWGLSDGSAVYDWSVPTLRQLQHIMTGLEALTPGDNYGFVDIQDEYYYTNTQYLGTTYTNFLALHITQTYEGELIYVGQLECTGLPFLPVRQDR